MFQEQVFEDEREEKKRNDGFLAYSRAHTYKYGCCLSMITVSWLFLLTFLSVLAFVNADLHPKCESVRLVEREKVDERV